MVVEPMVDSALVVTADWNSSLRQLFSVDSGAAGEQSVNAIAPSAASTTLARSSRTPVAASAVAAELPAALNTAPAGFFDTVSRLLSNLLPNPAGELLSGALLLMRRTLFPQVSPTASPPTWALIFGGSGPGVPVAAARTEISAPAAAASPVGVVGGSSANLNQQGTLIIRGGNATNIELRVGGQIAQVSVVVIGANGDQALGSWLLGSVQRVEYTGSGGNDTFNGAAVSKPMTITGNAGNDTLIGGGDRDTINGNGGNDVIRGGAGIDTINGGADNDTLSGGDGDDTIAGDAGNDVISGDGGNDTLRDVGGDDTIVGGDGNDWIQDSGPGRNTLLGGRGFDTIIAGDGTDLIRGDEDGDNIQAGGGNDTVYGDGGFDTIQGGAGDDLIYGGADNDTVSGGADNDTIYGDIGSDTLNGDAGNDTINGGDGDDIINANGIVIAGQGNDVLRGDAGNDTIKGGDGNDTITGGDGNDTIGGDAGNDFISGDVGNDRLTDSGGGDDTIAGGDGDDWIEDSFGGRNILLGGRGLDTIISGDGNDTIRGNEDADNILAGGGDDTVYGDAGSDTIRGGVGNDTLYGGVDNDILYGDTGNDLIYGDAGADTLYGGADNDTLSGGDGMDTLSGDVGADALFGGADNDTLSGGDGIDTLSGDAGNDRILGDAGNDTLNGGDGVDFLLGGAGADTLRGDGGNDTLNGNDGVDALFGGQGDDWLVGIDAAVDRLQGDAGRDIFWRDSDGNVTDTAVDFLIDVDADNAVRAFANGADRTLNGDRIAGPSDPTNAAVVDFSAYPLFSPSGPQGSDVKQGPFTGPLSLPQKDYTVVGAQLAGLAVDGDPSNAWLIRRAMVDFGDGTYGLALNGSYYRVDGRLPASTDLLGFTHPYYADFGADNSIWVAIAEKGIAMATPLRAGVYDYTALKPAPWGQMSGTGVFRLFGDLRAGLPISVVCLDVELGSCGGSADFLNTALLDFKSGRSYLTVALADDGDSGPYVGWVDEAHWRPGTLGRKFATTAGDMFALPMYYTVWAVEASGNQVTAVILRNPWKSDSGGRPVSYSDANSGDGLIRLTLDELSSSYRGSQLNILPRIA